ncbi:MAG: DUF2961 domain-containing protein [Novosphingobium sp.]
MSATTATSPALAGAQDAQPAMPVSSLYTISDARTRSLSPENPTGKKAGGSRATLSDGSDAAAARDLGEGWKVNPFVRIEAGQTYTVGNVAGPGIINHIWMTLGADVDYRSVILRLFWDGETTPSVEAPVGDFFAAGWGRDNEPIINSAVVAVNPRSGFNSYWKMPYSKNYRMTHENRGTKQLTVFYEVTFSEQRVPANSGYFHAQYRQIDRLADGQVFTIVDGIKGRGQYVGTALSHGSYSPGWWGEGEVKFYLDGDDRYPSINTTGEEDYFLGSWGFTVATGKSPAGKLTYYRRQDFSTLYAGFSEKPEPQTPLRKISEYRWHILDPIRFTKDLKVTIQGLGWRTDADHAYLPLHDYYASVAYWYQWEPHAAFPALPTDRELRLPTGS